jgi:hypothetical protein
VYGGNIASEERVTAVHHSDGMSLKLEYDSKPTRTKALEAELFLKVITIQWSPSYIYFIQIQPYALAQHKRTIQDE